MAIVKLRDLMNKNDYTLDVLSYHSGALNKAKIDAAVEAMGYTLPLPNKISFHLFKMNDVTATDVWTVTWHPVISKYSIEKLSLKG